MVKFQAVRALSNFQLMVVLVVRRLDRADSLASRVVILVRLQQLSDSAEGNYRAMEALVRARLLGLAVFLAGKEVVDREVFLA